MYKSKLTGVTLLEYPALIRGRACWNRLFRRDFWVSNQLSFPNAMWSTDIVPMTKAMVRARTIDVVPDIV